MGTLDPRDIAACVTLEGPQRCHQQGYAYIAALDLGIKHDHSACGGGRKAGCGQVPSGALSELATGQDGRVNLMIVESAVKQVWDKYRPIEIRYDEWQAALMDTPSATGRQHEASDSIPQLEGPSPSRR